LQRTGSEFRKVQKLSIFLFECYSCWSFSSLTLMEFNMRKN